ncbi:acyltransferase family protein [Sphingomonas sp. 2R-10]|uniref:acyltransferase family protein n=1 Tax=Sphingomonas sp. 2R-10 TaxID=3045148 RepID=UPI000F7691C5|nr:acyltransferase family protein [Sphingomonas sp. 2R-10]MDJ0278166.1 acyltransferase family protein [Sphingomonas sp. 2R-10]
MQPPQRFVGVDAWRAGLMLFGILLHALPERSHDPFFAVIGYVSTHVRMGAFMVVAGFLCGFVGARRSRRDWLRARIRTLAMPLATGLVLTVPTLVALRLHYATTALPIASLWFNWYHLWFLLALILYLPIAWLLAFGDTHARVSAWLTGTGAGDTVRQVRVIAAMLVASLGLMTLGIRLAVIVPCDGPTVLGALPQILGYAPLYAIGILLGRDGGLAATVLGHWRTMALLVAATLMLDCGAAWLTGVPSGIGVPQLSLLARAVLPGTSALLILRSALSIRHVPPLLRRIADASLTIYLVHFPLVKLLQALSEDVLRNDYLTFAFVVPVAAILSYAFHTRVVMRSPVLLWLFNGAPRPSFGTAPRTT